MPYKIGKILRDSDILTDEKINKTLEYQRKTGYRFGECLLHLNFCSEEELNYAISRQIELHRQLKSKGFKLKELKSLLKLVLSNKFLIFMLIFASFFAACLSGSLIFPIFIGFIIDQASSSTNFQTIAIFTGLALGAFVLGHVIEYFVNFCSISINTRVASTIYKSLYEHINKISFPFFTRFQKGDLLSRLLENIEAIIINIQKILEPFFINLFLFIILIVILFKINAFLTAINIVIIILCIVLPFLISDKANKYLSRRPGLIGAISTYLRETFNAFKFIKSSNKSKEFQSMFDSKLNQYYKNEAAKWFMWNLGFNTKVAINFLMFGIILWGGGHLVIKDAFSVGMLITYYFMVTQFMPKMDYFYQTYLDLQDLKSNWRRITQILNLPVERDSIENEEDIETEKIEEEITFSNINFKYKMHDNDLIKNFNLKLKRGEKYAIIGESGTGKSTFLKLVMGLYKPNSGTIFYDKSTHDKINLYSLWANIGYMEQEAFIYHEETVKENIKLGISGMRSNVTDEEIIAVSKKALIYDRIMSLPKGFDTIIDENVSFSGGEKQRIALARIFLRNPSLMILDEPTSALDPENTKMIMETIFNDCKDKILIVSSHQLDYLKDFKNCIYFSKSGITIIENDNGEVNKLLENFRSKSGVVYGTN